jgi:hypothetical protein
VCIPLLNSLLALRNEACPFFNIWQQRVGCNSEPSSVPFPSAVSSVFHLRGSGMQSKDAKLAGNIFPGVVGLALAIWA